jgi:hypothetical protein
MKKLFLSSDTVAARRNGSMLSQFQFDLTNELHTHDASKTTRTFIQVDNMQLFHSWFNVVGGTLEVNGVVTAVPDGQYTAIELLKALAPLDITFSNTTGMFSLNGGGTLGGTLGHVMGFDEGADGFNRSANIIFTSNVFVQTPGLDTPNYSSVDGRADVLCNIPVQAPAFEAVFYSGTTQETEISTARDLHTLSIELVDDRGALLDLRGIPWSMTLTLISR